MQSKMVGTISNMAIKKKIASFVMLTLSCRIFCSKYWYFSSFNLLGGNDNIDTFGFIQIKLTILTENPIKNIDFDQVKDWSRLIFWWLLLIWFNYPLHHWFFPFVFP